MMMLADSSVKAPNSTAFTPITSQDGFRVIFQLETLRSWRGARKRGKSTQVLALFAMEQASIVRIHSVFGRDGGRVSVILRPYIKVCAQGNQSNDVRRAGVRT